MTGYTGFSGDPEEQEGNYIALHFEDDDASSIAVKVIGSDHDPVTLDEDGLFVGRIADKSTQTIKVVASKTGYESVTKTYSLTGLTLADS